jgi:Mrp family chromosome partitioning ATPase
VLASPPQAAHIANVATIGAGVAYVSPAAMWPYLPDSPESGAQPLGLEVAAQAPARGRADAKRPLSSFTRRDGAIPLNSPAAILRPGTTIASFTWPVVCRRLLAQHGRRFDGASDALLAQAADGHSVVGVIGLFRRIGATTIALCLAARLAARGCRVILVDGHFQAPRLADTLGAEPTAWWQDVLARGAPLADAIIRADDENLDLLPWGPLSQGTRPSSGALQLAATAGALRHAYELVIVDLGTFFDPLSQPAALELIRHMQIDAAVAISAPERLDPRDLATVVDHLSESGCAILGTIENRVPNDE